MDIGIVGCGAVVREFYVKVLPRIPGGRICGVADLNRSSAEEVGAQFGAPVMDFDDLTELAEWVVVTTPPESHFTLGSRALEKGCHVVIEKPFVTSVEEARRLIQLGDQKGVAVSVAQFRRTFGPTCLARQLVANGCIGKIGSIEMFEGGKFAWATQSDYVRRSRYGGVLYDTGSHTVDQALFIAGLDAADIGVVVKDVVRDKVEPSHEIRAGFRIEHQDGSIEGVLFLSRAQSLANLVRIWGTEGQLEVDLGLDGGVTLIGRNGPVTLSAPNGVQTYPDAFLAEYMSIFTEGRTSRFAAATTCNQIKLIEAIHQYGA